MAVMIETMEMPKNCYDCKLSYNLGCLRHCSVLHGGLVVGYTETRAEDCPLREVKTGYWILCEVSSGRDSWQCSVCGRRARGKLENLPYCHCGAKMFEQKESEDKE